MQAGVRIEQRCWEGAAQGSHSATAGECNPAPAAPLVDCRASGAGQDPSQHHPSLKCITEMEAREQHKNLFLLNDVMDCGFPSHMSAFYFQRDASLLWLKQMLQAIKIVQGYKEPFISLQRPHSRGLQAQGRNHG